MTRTTCRDALRGWRVVIGDLVHAVERYLRTQSKRITRPPAQQGPVWQYMRSAWTPMGHTPVSFAGLGLKCGSGARGAGSASRIGRAVSNKDPIARELVTVAVTHTRRARFPMPERGAVDPRITQNSLSFEKHRLSSRCEVGVVPCPASCAHSADTAGRAARRRDVAAPLRVFSAS